MIFRGLKMMKKKLLGRKSEKIRHYLKVEQNKNQIQISGILRNNNYKVKQLWFESRFTDQIYKIDATTISNKFNFVLDVYEHKNLLEQEQDIFDLYLFVRVPREILSENQIIKHEENANDYFDEYGNPCYEYPIRLGRFAKTELIKLKPMTVNSKQFYLYNTIKGNLSLAINYELQPDTTVLIEQLKSKRHQINFNGKLFTKSSLIDKINLVMVGRETDIETKIPVNLHYMKDEVTKQFGLNRYKYETGVNLNEIFKDQAFNADIYDFYFDIKYHDYDEIIRVRVGKPRFRARFITKVSRGYRGELVFAASPYYTVKRFNLSLQIDSFERETYDYLRKISRWVWLLRPFYAKRNIWIVGERPYKAQDTGYYFFKYMRENYPEKEVYYVIENDSPELRNIESYGNILYYKSMKHIKYILMAKRIISSHHPDYLYPLRTKEFLKKVKAKKVFIQHGVLGTKNIEHFYGKDSPSFSTDLFLVSSDYERDIVINDFGYRPDEVMVTGLSRFDSLFAQDVKIKRQLLIIPTWREWLVQEDQFLKSEYYRRYKELVSNSTLHYIAKKYNFEIVFCLHPNMQKFTPYFKDSHIKIIKQGEVDVQYLLKESSMMITDYSSVAFDFSFLNKPIIYYQFDRERFIGKRGSHLDLNNDLPGDIVTEMDEIIFLIEKYAQSNFKMKDEFLKRAKKFLKYKDQQSSERIYQAIKKKIKKKPLPKRLVETELFRALFNRFRYSKYYFPAMKLFYRVAKRILPVDDKLILFESGIGQQYSDSPRNIYEEIIKRNLNFKKVWVCNKNVRFNDHNTIRIKRLSPSYYYYLAKAKIWINNQNFPTYIRKRPQTTYIQTWHGTPLKKMLYDIKNIMGRSDDYLERVSNATRTWDYLISPSPYATKTFKSAFRYEAKIIEVGYPRNDIFYKEDRFEVASKVRKRLNVPKDKKVILYAPTFRDNQTSGNNKFLFEIPMDLHQLKESLGDEYVFLLRMHVVISSKIKLDDDLNDFVMNVSNYSDIQELLLVTDILVTDYSSVMFDFANTKRPMLFYTYDLEEYRDDVRGFYMDFEMEAPGPLICTTEELIKSITNIKELESEFKGKYTEFYKKYCSLEDGQASKRVVDLLIDNYTKE